MKTNIFSFNRLGLLFRRFFAERSRYELIQWITMTIVFMFLRNFGVGIAIAIVVSGVIYASNFYKEIHLVGNGAAYFMIPASQLEKTILGVVITSFYYFAMIVVAYIIGNLLGTFLNNIFASMNIMINANIFGLNLFHYSPLHWYLFHIPVGPFEDTNGHTNFVIGLYELFWIGQSIYLLGSIYFKRNHFFATFLATNVIHIILLILFVLELKLFYGHESMTLNFNSANNRLFFYGFDKMIGRILEVGLWLLPPFFWVVSYFRLTEKQV